MVEIVALSLKKNILLGRTEKQQFSKGMKE